MARDTLADYFYKRLAGYHNKINWHVWNVEMGVQDSPNIPDITWLSPRDLDTDIISKARGIIHETLNNSGLFTTYAISVAGTGSWFPSYNNTTLPIPVPILKDGTESRVICEHIYNHAVAQGYRDNAMHKGIYLCPYPPLPTSDGLIGVWPEVAAAVALPELEKYWLVDALAILQYRTMRALLKIYSQTEGHTTIPGVGSTCIWAGWTHALDQINAANHNPHWCDSHKKFVEMVSKQLTYCNICGNYITAKFDWFDELQVGPEPNFEYLRAGGGFTAKCPYCETLEEDVPAFEDNPATKIQYATHYCPTCHMFQPTWAPYETDNQSKAVANLDGVDVYLSQGDLLNNIIASIVPASILTAMGIAHWQAGQPQRISNLVQLIKSSPEMFAGEYHPYIPATPLEDTAGAGLRYAIDKMQGKFLEWLGPYPSMVQREAAWKFAQDTIFWESRPYLNTEIPYTLPPDSSPYVRTAIPDPYFQPTSSKSVLVKTGLIILAIMAVITAIVLLTRKGIIVHHSYEGGAPIITTQKGGYGLPRCIKCEFEAMHQWMDEGSMTKPINTLVLMGYGTDISKAAYIPEWFIDASPQPMPGDPDYMV